jgi:lipoprotein-releasing system ATP-binding protein
MSAAPLVEIQNLTKTFIHLGAPLRILKGIDLTIREGDLISVMGMSGAGKSTFLQVLGTLDVPSSGRMLFQGTNVFSLSPDDLSRFRNRSIGFVFQFHHLLPEFSALENVMMPCMIARMPRREAEDRAVALLKEVGLGHRLQHQPSKLSGGEQQRVALARALVMEPALVLADEPTGNLDSQTSDGVHQLFYRLNQTRKTAMVLVTHNPALAALAQRRLKMVDGQMYEEPAGSPYRVEAANEESAGRAHAPLEVSTAPVSAPIPTSEPTASEHAPVSSAENSPLSAVPVAVGEPSLVSPLVEGAAQSFEAATSPAMAERPAPEASPDETPRP